MIKLVPTLRDRLQRVDHLALPGCDDFPRSLAPWVKRQYVGCAGKVANAVNFVNAT
jgi:hypothetical protein